MMNKCKRLGKRGIQWEYGWVVGLALVLLALILLAIWMAPAYKSAFAAIFGLA